jgi:CubicO group peptidase (beta-lactamase class C family)
VIPASLIGVWAATAPVVSEYRWQPRNPLPADAHYFLVVSKGAGGTVRAFIRNPEFNAGARYGTRDTLDYTARADGTIQLDKVTPEGKALTFHRAGATDLTWYYPRPTAQWTYSPPSEQHDGWNIASLSDVHMSARPIARLMSGIVALRTPSLRSPYIQSISIERHGKLVLDEYFYGFGPDRPHDVRSAGKSVTTLLVGRAIADTHAFTPQSLVVQQLSAYAPFAHDDVSKRAMTVADLMTMASGLACNDNDDASPGNEDTMQSQPAGTNWYKYTLDLPMAAQPGTRAVYCTAGINLLGAIVSGATHVPLDDYFAKRFAQPMNFGTYGMWLMPDPSAVYMGGGDYFRPRDFLKFGRLVLEAGQWNGTPIVSESWIRDSIVPRVSPEGEGDQYGYGWHVQDVTVNGAPIRVINAGGNGGQLLLIIPALDVSVMVTAGNYNQFPVWRNFLPEIARTVSESCS